MTVRARRSGFRLRAVTTALTVALASTFASAPASADPPPAPSTAPSPTAPKAAPSTAPVAPSKKANTADRDAARTLAEQGFERLQQAKYSDAITLFTRAEERYHAPTHFFYIAQAREKRGELIEAADAYRKVIAEVLAPDAPQPFRDAQAAAAPALQSIERRIPKLRVDVSGTAADRARIVVGDRPVTSGASALWNPGTYLVRVTADGPEPVERSVILTEGAGEVVVRIQLARSYSIAWPILALGLGVVGTAVSIGTGVTSRDLSLEADKICADVLVCPPEQIDDQSAKYERAQELRAASIATGVVGGVALLGGVALFLFRPTTKTSVQPPQASAPTARMPGATLAVRAGPSFIGVTGSF